MISEFEAPGRLMIFYRSLTATGLRPVILWNKSVADLNRQLADPAPDSLSIADK